MNEEINITIVKGGFILTHYDENGRTVTEVLVAPRKLINRVKELIAERGLVADEKAE
jgi:hypothetical protein